MTVKIKVDKITPSLKRKRKELKAVPKVAYDFWKKTTPIDRGNARRRTRLKGRVIQARYPYAKRLDEGWSKQAPQGMFKPLVKYLNRYTKTLIKRKR